MDDPGRTSNGQRLRYDGWTPDRRRKLLERVAAGESIVSATRALNKSTTSLYQLRGRDPEFARELHFALEVSHDSFEAEAHERGLGNFEEVETVDGSERRTRRYSDKLLICLLRHRRSMLPPRDTGDGGRSADELSDELRERLTRAGLLRET